MKISTETLYRLCNKYQWFKHDNERKGDYPLNRVGFFVLIEFLIHNVFYLRNLDF